MNSEDNGMNSAGNGGTGAKKRRRRGGRRHRRGKPGTGATAPAGSDAEYAAVGQGTARPDDNAGDDAPFAADQAGGENGGLPGGKKRRRRGGRRHRRKNTDAGASGITPAVAAALPRPAAVPRQPRRPAPATPRHRPAPAASARPDRVRADRPLRDGKRPRGRGGRESGRLTSNDPRLLPGAADVLAELGSAAAGLDGVGEIKITPLELVIPDMQVRKLSPAAHMATTRPARGPRDFRPQGEDRLRPVLPVTDDFALYSIEGASTLKRLVASTPETRLLLNRPEIVGGQVTVALRTALARLLSRAGQEIGTAGLDDRATAVLNFLRGGLAFGLREALTEAAGLNRAALSFASAERYREGHNWKIRKDGYREYHIPDEAQLFVAEVVATGTTLAHGLDQLIDEMKREHKKLRGITVFAIGSDRTEQVLAKVHERCRQEFGRTYGQTVVVYLEGRFGLAGAVKSPVVSEPGTDLLRFPALLAPEFELSQFERLSYPLERCAIYDLGMRAFSPLEHLMRVKEFWRQVMEQGISFEEAYRERWPLRPQSGGDISDEYARLWREVPAETLGALAEARTKLWALLDTEGKTRAAHIRACSQRISELEKLMG